MAKLWISNGKGDRKQEDNQRYRILIFDFTDDPRIRRIRAISKRCLRGSMNQVSQLSSITRGIKRGYESSETFFDFDPKMSSRLTGFDNFNDRF